VNPLAERFGPLIETSGAHPRWCWVTAQASVNPMISGCPPSGFNQ